MKKDYTISEEQKMMFALRILFQESIRLVPSGIRKGEDLYRWEMSISEEMAKRVINYTKNCGETIKDLEKKLKVAKKALKKFSIDTNLVYKEISTF